VPGGFNALSTLTPADPPIAVPFPSDVTFSGPAFSEPRLIALAYAFEQATQHRVPPASTPALASDTVRSKRQREKKEGPRRKTRAPNPSEISAA